MKVSIVQTDIHWENIDKNLDHFAQKIKMIDSTDIIVLPEMFSTGFSLNVADLAENMDGKTMIWLKNQAESTDALLISSIIIKEEDLYYNRCFCVFPNGEYQYYDKVHLFTDGNEHHVYTAGKENIMVEYKGWKIRPMICYDLRFPVWARNTDGYDILVYLASWPQVRSEAWSSLLKARAVENQCYVLVSNRIGEDHHYKYDGKSAIIDFYGNVKIESIGDEILSYKLEKAAINKARVDFPVLNDMDKFQII